MAPLHATTIPRLELCAAVLAVELADLIQEEQVVKADSVSFYSDSKVVLGYIANETRRFYVYVGNRVERIRRSPTNCNPADLGTRSVDASLLQDSVWITGPQFLHHVSLQEDVQTCREAKEVCSTTDSEIRPEVIVKKTEVRTSGTLGTERFSRFSKWSSLVRAISLLIKFMRSRRAKNAISSPSQGPPTMISPVEVQRQAEKLIIASVQQEAFGDVMERLKHGEQLTESNPVLKLTLRSIRWASCAWEAASTVPFRPMTSATC